MSTTTSATPRSLHRGRRTSSSSHRRGEPVQTGAPRSATTKTPYVDVNADAITFQRVIGERVAGDVEGTLVSGMIGPRGDGYAAASGIDPDEAAAYHRAQVAAFAGAGADLVTAVTLTTPVKRSA